MYIGLCVRYLLFMSDFNETLIFLAYLKKNTHISIFMKICPVGAKFFRVNRERDMTKLTVAFCNFANAPRKDMT